MAKMSIKIEPDKVSLLLKVSKSITSNRSIVKFNNSSIIVNSIFPINNILGLNIGGSNEGETYEMEFSSFVTILKTLLSKGAIEINLSSNNLLMEFKSKKKTIKTGDFKIVKHNKDVLIGKYEFLNLDKDFLSQIKTHIKNISYSNILTNLNGIFLVGNNIYSANAFSVLRTTTQNQIYWADKAGVFLPVEICSMILDLASSNLKLLVDSESNFVMCLSDLFNISFPIGLFDLEENIRLNLESVIDSIEEDALWDINLQSLLNEIDPKTLQSLSPEEVILRVEDNNMKILFNSNLGVTSTEFESTLEIDNLSGENLTLSLETKELITFLDIAQPYAMTSVRLDTNKTKASFSLGGTVLILALN